MPGYFFLRLPHFSYLHYTAVVRGSGFVPVADKPMIPSTRSRIRFPAAALVFFHPPPCSCLFRRDDVNISAVVCANQWSSSQPVKCASSERKPSLGYWTSGGGKPGSSHAELIPRCWNDHGRSEVLILMRVPDNADGAIVGPPTACSSRTALWPIAVKK